MHIDIVHDTACPWCRIGKHNLRAAVAHWAGEPISVRFIAYFLNPHLPPEGMPYRELMASKYPGVSVEQLFDGPSKVGAQVGLTFNFDAMTRAPKTLLSHRLIALTPPEHRERMIDAVYDTFFEHGKDIGRLDVLVDLAAGVGLDRAEMQRLLESDAAEADVLSEAQQTAQMGITGVPFFIFNGKWALSGAQPPDVFAQVLERVAAESAAQAP
ncbi:MAG: DsbA family oxidoreductase [Chloroflexi bacterium]|nr:DsbA family oxidoreductase [Chloroflexota bacterium]